MEAQGLTLEDNKRNLEAKLMNEEAKETEIQRKTDQIKDLEQ